MEAYLGAAVGLVLVLVGLAYGFGLFTQKDEGTPPKPDERKPPVPSGGSAARADKPKPGDEKPKPAASEGKPKAPRDDKPPPSEGKPKAPASEGKPKAPASEGKPKAPASEGKLVTKPNDRALRSEAPALSDLLEDGDDDVTIVTLAPRIDLNDVLHVETEAETKEEPKAPPKEAEKAPEAAATPKPAEPAPKPAEPELPAAWSPQADDEDEPAVAASAVPIFSDDDAQVDEPTRVSALILVAAAAGTDRGRRRKRNEDCFVVLEDHNLFVVADGMGGHAGGEIASRLAADTIAEAFRTGNFKGEPYANVPRRGSELALAIQMANRAIFDRAKNETALTGMGTTVVAARFSPNKQRVYIGHVGDSRAYRLRSGELQQITTDHTMGASGVTGPLASHLLRAVGILPAVKIDLLIGRPRPEDIYLFCSDGLTKMVPNDQIRDALVGEKNLDKAVEKLVELANARGGRDNITVVLVQVKDPRGLAEYVKQKS